MGNGFYLAERERTSKLHYLSKSHLYDAHKGSGVYTSLEGNESQPPYHCIGHPYPQRIGPRVPLVLGGIGSKPPYPPMGHPCPHTWGHGLAVTRRRRWPFQRSRLYVASLGVGNFWRG